jgi:hypothetical protein
LSHVKRRDDKSPSPSLGCTPPPGVFRCTGHGFIRFISGLPGGCRRDRQGYENDLP